jgi:hypothetical protein
MADAIVLRKDHTLILSAEAPRRVLFWQQDATLSAPEIWITQDKTLLGKGDLRCTLNREEEKMLNQLISKYL